MDLEATLHRLAPRVLGYCIACAGHRQDAEEAAQDALTALVQRWRRHGPPDSPDAFVFTIARRRLRRTAIRRWLLTPFTADHDGRPPSTGVDHEAEARIELERALRALATLPAAERQALLLVAVAELPLAEAAAVTRISISAMKMRVHRARRRLHGVLHGDNDA
jgi:RNA polymerase sigma-70 factor (ECF subfamily)